MNLYFRDSGHNKRLIAPNLQSEKEVWLHINKFLNEHNFKSYYTRIWYKDGYTWCDVGSHTEFFMVDANLIEQYENEQEEEKTIQYQNKKRETPIAYQPE